MSKILLTITTRDGYGCNSHGLAKVSKIITLNLSLLAISQLLNSCQSNKNGNKQEAL